jgi:hypothetical protein
MTTSDSQSEDLTRDDAVEPASAESVRSSAAQRQWAYRQRRKHATIDAIGNETAASRATLLALLANELATLDARTSSATMTGPARNTARRVLKELITRYAIELRPD